jgi:hypothetical protein
VLRLLDARTGSYAELRPARPGWLRICAQAPQQTEEPVLSGLRMLLVTDLLSRTAELSGLQALTALVFPGLPPERPASFERAAGALGIHPPAARVSSPDAGASLAGPVDVSVIIGPSRVDDSMPGLVMGVGAARIPRAGSHDEHAAGIRGHDPLAVRLALMSFPHNEEADLTDSVLTRGSETIADWRRQVAEWAESPSRPMPDRLEHGIRAAFDDLDILGALALLRGVALDTDVPPGAKFETFAYADRILGLELAREIGRYSRPR